MQSEPEQLVAVAVHSCPESASVLAEQLARINNVEADLLHLNEPEQVLRNVLARPEVNLIILYCRQNSMPLLGWLKQLRGAGDSRPVIAVLHAEAEHVAAAVTLAGADEYLLQRELTRVSLLRSIDVAMARTSLRLAAEHGDKQQQEVAGVLRRLAEANVELALTNRNDSLTKILNRGAWEDSMGLEHDRSVRFGHTYGIIMLDVDFFKAYNDSQGHRAGDDCLRAFAKCLSTSVRTYDMVGRYGGEEFCILAPETNLAGAMALAERLRLAILSLNIAHPFSAAADRISASFGVATGPGAGWERALQDADVALYRAKDAGRNCISAAAPVVVD